jgi:hypothetical protein
MQKHVTLVGALHIGYSAVQILGAMAAFLFIVGGGMIGGYTADEWLIISITSLLGTMIALWIILVSVPGIVGGIGLLRHKPWGRYAVLVLSVIILFSIPIGTALGAYSIWVLLQDETAELLISRDT